MKKKTNCISGSRLTMKKLVTDQKEFLNLFSNHKVKEHFSFFVKVLPRVSDIVSVEPFLRLNFSSDQTKNIQFNRFAQLYLKQLKENSFDCFNETLPNQGLTWDEQLVVRTTILSCFSNYYKEMFKYCPSLGLYKRKKFSSSSKNKFKDCNSFFLFLTLINVVKEDELVKFWSSTKNTILSSKNQFLSEVEAFLSNSQTTDPLSVSSFVSDIENQTMSVFFPEEVKEEVTLFERTERVESLQETFEQEGSEIKTEIVTEEPTKVLTLNVELGETLKESDNVSKMTEAVSLDSESIKEENSFEPFVFLNLVPFYPTLNEYYFGTSHIENPESKNYLLQLFEHLSLYENLDCYQKVLYEQLDSKFINLKKLVSNKFAGSEKETEKLIEEIFSELKDFPLDNFQNQKIIISTILKALSNLNLPRTFKMKLSFSVLVNFYSFYSLNNVFNAFEKLFSFLISCFLKNPLPSNFNLFLNDLFDVENEITDDLDLDEYTTKLLLEGTENELKSSELEIGHKSFQENAGIDEESLSDSAKETVSEDEKFIKDSETEIKFSELVNELQETTDEFDIVENENLVSTEEINLNDCESVNSENFVFSENTPPIFLRKTFGVHNIKKYNSKTQKEFFIPQEKIIFLKKNKNQDLSLEEIKDFCGLNKPFDVLKPLNPNCIGDTQLYLKFLIEYQTLNFRCDVINQPNKSLKQFFLILKDFVMENNFNDLKNKTFFKTNYNSFLKQNYSDEDLEAFQNYVLILKVHVDKRFYFKKKRFFLTYVNLSSEISKETIFNILKEKFAAYDLKDLIVGKENHLNDNKIHFHIFVEFNQELIVSNCNFFNFVLNNQEIHGHYVEAQDREVVKRYTQKDGNIISLNFKKNMTKKTLIADDITFFQFQYNLVLLQENKELQTKNQKLEEELKQLKKKN